MTVYDNDENVVPKPDYPDSNYVVKEVRGSWMAHHVSEPETFPKYIWIPETKKWNVYKPWNPFIDRFRFGFKKFPHTKIALIIFGAFFLLAFIIWSVGD